MDLFPKYFYLIIFLLLSAGMFIYLKMHIYLKYQIHYNYINIASLKMLVSINDIFPIRKNINDLIKHNVLIFSVFKPYRVAYSDSVLHVKLT